jgi:hypothetical protein
MIVRFKRWKTHSDGSFCCISIWAGFVYFAFVVFVNFSGHPLTGMCYECGEKQFLMEAVRDLLCWIIGGRKPHVVR